MNIASNDYMLSTDSNFFSIISSSKRLKYIFDILKSFNTSNNKARNIFLKKNFSIIYRTSLDLFNDDTHINLLELYDTFDLILETIELIPDIVQKNWQNSSLIQLLDQLYYHNNILEIRLYGVKLLCLLIKIKKPINNLIDIHELFKYLNYSINYLNIPDITPNYPKFFKYYKDNNPFIINNNNNPFIRYKSYNNNNYNDIDIFGYSNNKLIIDQKNNNDSIILKYILDYIFELKNDMIEYWLDLIHHYIFKYLYPVIYNKYNNIKN